MALFNSEDYIKKVMESESIDDCPKVPLPEIDEKQNYIFISYSHRDYKQVFSDLALMYEKGVRFWYDYDLVAGKNWNKEAFKKIRDPRCSGVVFYLSENLFLSQSVIEEIRITLGLDNDNQPVDKPVNYFSVNLTELMPSDIIFKARASMSDEEWRARGYDGDWNLTLLTAFRDKATYVKFNTPDHNNQLITQIKKNFNVMDDESSKQGKYEGEMLNGKRHGFGKAVYDNGTVYEGYWENDKKHGKGKYIYPESSKSDYFEGTFVNDVIQGYGVYQIKNGTKYEGNFTDGKTTGDFTATYNNGEVYIGQLVNSIRQGKGKLIYGKEDNRDYYEGDWDNGNRHGEGTLVWKSGARYTGQWGSDLFNGKGRYDYAETSTWLYYEGEYINDKKEGYGKMEYRNGDSWEGIWKDGNKYTGTGTVVYNDGKKYTGELKEAKFEGQGAITYASGETYIGEFKSDKRTGFGKGVSTSGRIYEGQWKDDHWDGIGKVTYEEGNKWISYEGEFKEGKITGTGKIIYAENSNMLSYEGEMLEAIRHGEGTLIWKNGATFKGHWEKGIWEGKGRLDYEEDNDWLYYEGEYKNDSRDGYGKMEYRNGDSWEGTWKNGSRYTGVGTVTYTSGNKYTGELKESKFSGQGTLVYANGEKYVGEFKNDKYDGKGELIYSKNANVVSYKGEFKAGKRHGNGKLIFTNGDTYEGSWFEDKRHGYGVTIYAMNKGLYKEHHGGWLNSNMHFYGEYIMLDGSKWTGMFEDGLLNGAGTIVNKRGKAKHVIWKNGAIDPQSNKFTRWLWNSVQNVNGYIGEEQNGVPNGFGVYHYDDGSVYEGNFKDGIFEGTGRLVDRLGNEYIGDFKNGMLNGKCAIKSSDWLYIGECVDDKMCGQGELHIKFYCYNGTFEKNQPKGEGYVTGISGKKYKFIDDKCTDEKAADPIKNFFKTTITLR